MAENSLLKFIAKNKVAILTTVSAGTAAVGAYLYYQQLKQQQEQQHLKGTKERQTSTTGDEGEVRLKEDSSIASGSKKKKKNRRKRKNKTKAVEGLECPVLSDGELDMGQLKSLSFSQRQEFAVQLKDKGNHCFTAKNFDEAIKYYQYAIELDPNDPVFYSNISACYISTGNLDKVIEYTTKALEIKPDHSKALLRRASANESLGNFTDAMFDLSVLSLNGDFDGASIEPMLERNLNKQAMKVLNDNLTKNSDGRDLQVLPSNTSLASFFGIFDCDLEISRVDTSSHLDNAHTMLSEALQMLYSATSEGYVLANDLFTKATQAYHTLLSADKVDAALRENAALAFCYTGIFQFLKNDLLDAQALLQEAINLHPTPNACIFMALTLADKENSQDFFRFFQQAIELDPEYPPTYYHRGQMYFILQDYTNAKTDFQKAQSLNPGNIYPYIQLACLLYKQGKFTESEALFNEAKLKFPTLPEVPTFFAEILTDKGDFNTAIKQYDIAKRLEEVQKKIHVGIGPLIGKATILARQSSQDPTQLDEEKFNMAIELLTKACELDPRSEQAKIGLAQLKLQMENIDEAIELFQDSASLARTMDEKLQATTFAEAAKIQKRLRADPIISAKMEQTLATYRAKGML